MAFFYLGFPCRFLGQLLETFRATFWLSEFFSPMSPTFEDAWLFSESQAAHSNDGQTLICGCYADFVHLATFWKFAHFVCIEPAFPGASPNVLHRTCRSRCHRTGGFRHRRWRPSQVFESSQARLFRNVTTRHSQCRRSGRCHLCTRASRKFCRSVENQYCFTVIFNRSMDCKINCAKAHSGLHNSLCKMQ